MARRTVQGMYSEIKMFGKYYRRFTGVYEDRTLALAAAGMALGERDEAYNKLRRARLAATGVGRDVGIGGPFLGQLQAYVMRVLKQAGKHVDNPTALCEYVEAVITQNHLENVGYGDGKTLADALRKYFGCGSASATPTPSSQPAPTAPTA